MEDFVTLPHQIQNSLLQHNADMIVSHRGADFFHATKEGQDQLLCSLGIDDLKTASNIVEEVKATHNTNDQDFEPIEYKNFNTIQERIDDSEDKDRYDQLLLRVGADASLDENTLILLTYVILHCTDFSDETMNKKRWNSIKEAKRRLITII